MPDILLCGAVLPMERRISCFRSLYDYDEQELINNIIQ